MKPGPREIALRALREARVTESRPLAPPAVTIIPRVGLLPTVDTKRRGRPKTGSALTPAEKQRAYRERKRVQKQEPLA